jgi:glycerophosphoryl diester phosphodiesterase
MKIASAITALLLVAVCKPAMGAEPRLIVMPDRGICAHRGASSTHPENTLPAFEEAIRLGAHQIEFDVYLTKDKRCVVIHDPTVDRTTNGSGKVSELTLAQIKQLDAGRWKEPRFAGLRVPTLAETLAMMPINVWLNVHTKGGRELGAAVAREIVRQDRLHQAFLATGHDAADGARSVAPDILVCNMHNQGHGAAYVSDTIERGDRFIQLYGGLPSPEDFARLEQAGVRVNYFGTNDPKALPKLYEAGVQFPLVDAVGPMMKAAAELGIEPLCPVYRNSR